MSFSHLQLPLRRLQATAFDGSVGYPRFREDQLAILYNGLSDARTQLAEALQADLRRSPAEAQFEVAAALRSARERAQATEYAGVVKQAERDLTAGKVQHGVGMVTVVADESSPLLSVVAPLANAIAGGNAVAVILSDRSAQLNALLATVIGALEPTSFLVLNPEGSTSAALDFVLSFPFRLIVAPSLSPNQLNLTQRKGIKTLLASATAPSPTVIITRDRRLSLREIARLVVRGQFWALGRLPGSVARVLVQDDIAAEFTELVIEETKIAFGSNSMLSGDYGRFVDGREVGKLGEIVRGVKGRAVLGGDSAVTDYFPPTVIEDAPKSLLSQTTRGPILALNTFSSLEGVLATIDSLSTDVLYLFSAADEIKYFADATQKTVIYDNDIPILALFRPNPSLDSPAHFTRATQVISATAAPADAQLFAPFTSAKLTLLAKLLPRERKVSVKRTPFNNTTKRVFFLQGVFISLGSVLVVVGSILGYGGWRGVRWFRG